MRILILGKNYSAQKFFNYFNKNKEDIVFSTNSKTANFVELLNPQEILDFCLANEINLVLITDENYINEGIQELLCTNNITVFSPSIDAINICASKAYSKKFIYKNKFQSPKFIVAEKPQNAHEFINSSNFPLAVKPDNHNDFETVYFIENKKQAQNAISNYFANDNQKIIIEDYIEGKNVRFWVLTDGYSAKILFKSAIYQNEISLFEPEFVADEVEEKIYKDIISPTIQALASQDEEYIGILGFDFILTYDNKPYLLGFDSFFDELNVDFALEVLNFDWKKIFESTIIGDVFLNNTFEKTTAPALCFKENTEIEMICANSKTNLKRYLKELEIDTAKLKEAEKLWKY